ncbi:MAG: leucine-rich repeat protein [Acutalibacteraceae bacterium]|nr:leucine-rich repeat protein [Acutalibacteraceae bacterium]
MLKICKTIACTISAVIAGASLIACDNENPVTKNSNLSVDSIYSENSTVNITGEYNGFIYEKGEKSITIKQYKGTEKDVVIPEKIENINVTNIDSRCFENTDNEDIINSVTLPSTITDISALAFYNSRFLNRIVCDENTHYISYDGVLYTSDMASLVAYPENKENSEYDMPDSIIHIYNNAFSFCDNLKKVTLSENLDIIPDYTFAYNQSIEVVITKGNIKEIGFAAFCKCSNLESITLTENIEEINDNAIIFCDKLESIQVIGDCPTIEKYAEGIGVTYKSN